MKNRIITATAAVIFGALSLTSCKKECDCDKDKKVTEETTATDTTSMAPAASSDMDNPGTTGGKSSGSGNGKTTGTKGSAARGDRSTLSKPAKDGTDAENHDGDYYTRNDTARKPTGSIK